jgi:hypothetical protein
MPTGLLRTALGVVLITSSLALFDKAGVDLPTAVFVGIPSAFLIGLIAQRLARRVRILPPASESAGGAVGRSL